MVIVSTKAVDVQCDAGLHSEAVEDVRDHLTAEIADLLTFESKLSDAVRPRADVDDCSAEGLVERCMPGTVSLDALDGSQGLLESSAESKRTILGGVVVVNPKVTFTGEGQRHATVLGERVKHLLSNKSRMSDCGEHETAETNEQGD